jgi:formate dehydrogenase subunit gamma
MGGKDIENTFKSKLGLDWGETTADQAITLEPVYCLGNCACSPSVRIGKQIYGRVSPEQVDTLIASARGGK